jgi:hypothetical protein
VRSASIFAYGAFVAACGSVAADDALPRSEAQSLFSEPVTALVAGDDRLFMLTHDALVSVPKAGGPHSVIASRAEATFDWEPLARGGTYVVAALGSRGPVAVVDQATSNVVATWTPPADFREEPWAIRCVATDGFRVYVGLAEGNDASSIVALPAATMEGAPETVIDYAADGVTDARDVYAPEQIVVDGPNLYVQVRHLTRACPTCGLVQGADFVDRWADGATSRFYEGHVIGQMALADDALWVLEGGGDQTNVVRIAKRDAAIRTFGAAPYAKVLLSSHTSAFTPTNGPGGVNVTLREVDGREAIALRPSAVVGAAVIDDDAVYAAVRATEQDCSGTGKALFCTQRTIVDGLDRMPRPR